MRHTKAVFDEEIEGVAVAVVGELVVRSRELLEALGGDAGEISCELRVLSQNHSAPSHEAVDQRLLPHLTTENPNPVPPTNQSNRHKSFRYKGRDDGIGERNAGFALLRNGYSTPVVYIVLLIYISIFIFRKRKRGEKEREVYRLPLK
jgi:hypothetical protein